MQPNQELNGACPFCLSREREEPLTVRELSRGSGTPFLYCKCSICGSYRCLDFPEDIAAWYEGYGSFTVSRRLACVT